MYKLIPILTTLGALASAAFLAQLELSRRRVIDFLVIDSGYWAAVAIDLTFIIILFLSSWLIAIRFSPPRWLSIFIVIVALVGILSNPLSTLGIAPFYSLVHYSPLWSVLGGSQPGSGSFFFEQSLAILLSALYALFRPLPK